MILHEDEGWSAPPSGPQSSEGPMTLLREPVRGPGGVL